jgi:hypothetical protein
MEYNFNEASGMSNAPLFIGYTPFKLDFSPVKETAELKANIRAQKQKDLEALKKRVSDLKMPEFTGLASDLSTPYNQALTATTAMMESLQENSNPHWAAKHDPKFLAAQQLYAQATSPALQASLTQEKEAHAGFVKRFTERDAQGSMLFGPDGMAYQDPDNPSAPITAGEFADRREDMESYNLFSGRNTDLNSAIVPDPKGFMEDISKSMQSTGIIENRNNLSNNANAWNQLREAATDPYSQVAAEMIVNQGWKTNSKNLGHAVKKIQSSMTKQQWASVQQMYLESEAFVRRDKSGAVLPEYRKDPYKDLRDKDGNFDPVKLYNLTTNDAAFQIDGSKEPVTLLEKLLAEQVGQFLVQEQFTEARLLKQGGMDGNGGGGPRPRLTPYWGHMMNGIPKEFDANGNEIPLKPVTTMTVPVAAYEDGTIPGTKAGDLYTQGVQTNVYARNPDFSVWPKSLQALGLYDKNNNPKFSEEQPLKLGSVAGSQTVVGQGGRTFDKNELDHLNVIGVEPKVYYMHRSVGTGADTQPDVAEAYGFKYGNDGKPRLNSDSGASSDYWPFLKIKVRFDDDDLAMMENFRPKDYFPQDFPEGVGPRGDKQFVGQGPVGRGPIGLGYINVASKVADAATGEGQSRLTPQSIEGMAARRPGSGYTVGNWDPGITDSEGYVYLRADRAWAMMQGSDVNEDIYKQFGPATMPGQASHTSPDAVLDQYIMAPQP